MTALSKTAAIAKARTLVGMPIRRSSTDYVVYAPWDSAKPEGASTELRASSYPQALARRSAAVACIALHYMGRLTDDAYFAVHNDDHYGARTVEDLVAAGLKAAA